MAVAAAVKEGRSICLCQAEVHDEDGTLVAHGTSKLLVLRGKQSIAEAARIMERPALPSKLTEE